MENMFSDSIETTDYNEKYEWCDWYSDRINKCIAEVDLSKKNRLSKRDYVDPLECFCDMTDSPLPCVYRHYAKGCVADEPKFLDKENTHNSSYTWRKSPQISKYVQTKTNVLLYKRPMTRYGAGQTILDSLFPKKESPIMTTNTSCGILPEEKQNILHAKPDIHFSEVIRLLKTYGKLVVKKYGSYDNMITYVYRVPLDEEFGDGHIDYMFNIIPDSHLINESRSRQTYCRKNSHSSRKIGNFGKNKKYFDVPVY